MRGAVLTLAAALLACSAERQPAPARALPTPLGLDAAAAERPAEANGGASRSFSIEEFAPLLAGPSLARAAEAVERGDAAAAARRVAAAMAKQPPPGADVPRWQYLLARLREQAGQVRAAAASYELAAAARWPLSGYALLGAGRTLVRGGRLDDALKHLERVPLDQPIADETRLLIAEIASHQRDFDLAIATWRQHLASADEPTDWVDVSLRLSEALLGRAQPSAPTTGAAPSARAQDEVKEALALARRVRLRNVGSGAVTRRATRLEERALGALPPADRGRLRVLTPADHLERVRVLVAGRLYPRAEEVARELLQSLRGKQRWAELGCETAVLRSKAVAGQRAWGRAADSLSEVIRRCRGDDLRARALYLAGKYAAADGRHMQAVTLYEKLEKEIPEHRLADDARLRAAFSYYELGVEARFTELLTRMPEDYPEGDMVLDGVFRLALRRIEKGDWSGAASVLDRGAALVQGRDSARGTELSGRERYFRARAWIATGEKKRGLDEYAAIIGELPLSYYMLHAYSRMIEADPFRAKRVRDEAVRRAAEQPFSFAHRPEFDQPGFLRAMELLRVGDIEAAKREIQMLGIARRGAAPEILWGVTLLYARAGAAKLSHGIARGLLTDWLARWPAGDWARAWELAFPRPYHRIVQRETQRTGVPEWLVYGVMREESAFDAGAVSPAEAHGLMQLIVPTARLYARPAGLPFDSRSLKRPAVNVALGCRALASLSETFKTNPVLAIPGYNAGPGRPRRWLRELPRLDFDVWVELIPIRETRRYTKRVLASRAAYAYLYDREVADEVMALPIRLEY